MKQPKLLEKLFVFYPAFQSLWIAHDLILFIQHPNVFSFSRLILVCYFLSPLLWWVCRSIFSEKTEGAFKVGKHAKEANSWLLYYQLQSIYTHFYFFERVLKIFPGFYSAWLRLWGSKIGVKVNWTAECQIVDRGHMIVGDRVFFGNRSYFSAHALKKIGKQYLLYVKSIEIGSDSMVSYACHVGPGVKIGVRSMIDAGASLYPNVKIADGESYAFNPNLKRAS